LAFFDSSLLSCHFRLFTEVLRKVFGSLTQEVWEFFGETPDYPLRDSYGAQAADVRAYDCRGSRVGCSVINARVTPIRLRSGQALPLQLDYLGANEATIFSKRGSPGNRCCLIWEFNELFQLGQNLFFSWTYQNRPLIVAIDAS